MSIEKASSERFGRALLAALQQRLNPNHGGFGTEAAARVLAIQAIEQRESRGGLARCEISPRLVHQAKLGGKRVCACV